MFQLFLNAGWSLHFLAEFDIPPYQPPQHPWYWPFRFVLIGLAIRAAFWLFKQLPAENKSPQPTANEPAATRKPPRPAPAAPIDPVPVTAMEVLVLEDGQQLGPFSVEEINRQLSAGTVLATNLAWHEGLSGWVPLATVVGVETPVPAHGLHPPPPPVYTTGMPATLGGTLPPPSNGILIGGYICAVVSLMFLPPVLGLAGIICGVVAITRQQVNKGVTLLIVSFVCAALGMMIGAATQ